MAVFLEIELIIQSKRRLLKIFDTYAELLSTIYIPTLSFYQVVHFKH